MHKLINKLNVDQFIDIIDWRPSKSGIYFARGFFQKFEFRQTRVCVSIDYTEPNRCMVDIFIVDVAFCFWRFIVTIVIIILRIIALFIKIVAFVAAIIRGSRFIWSWLDNILSAIYKRGITGSKPKKLKVTDRLLRQCVGVCLCVFNLIQWVTVSTS